MKRLALLTALAALAIPATAASHTTPGLHIPGVTTKKAPAPSVWSLFNVDKRTGKVTFNTQTKVWYEAAWDYTFGWCEWGNVGWEYVDQFGSTHYCNVDWNAYADSYGACQDSEARSVGYCHEHFYWEYW